jgi:hypothetical protein
MSAIRTGWLLILVVTLSCGAFAEEASKTNSTVQITVIKYCLEPFETGVRAE